jgi:hypothetical protein
MAIGKLSFIGYIRPEIRRCKTDWDAEVEITPEIREALHPRDVGTLRVGVLRRPFHWEPSRPGTRGSPRQPIAAVHAKDSLVFAVADDSFFLLEYREPK